MENKVIEKTSKPSNRHTPRRIEYWAGKKLTKASSDLFLDRPRPANTLFSGPNAVLNQHYPIRDTIGEVNDGEASVLRSLDLGYLTRGYAIDPPLRRTAFPGEIGWTAIYYRRYLKHYNA
ncbi:unnamed protein product [Rotaria magnacalcarata]|nr:unnamed protein product [Rotaria magnacalcarata]CAF1567136.1 unnamed protein product [Rotaria magnacalcarata]CAF1923058.1 unnamed protein product [Rotaria magnacalcarata]CAF4061018.1 unnamed protein product [Rotaria magnacalcarata]CAF5054133.1 unnamed protein product [Rotaria magnacalcarata]